MGLPCTRGGRLIRTLDRSTIACHNEGMDTNQNFIVIPDSGDIAKAAGTSWGPFTLDEARAWVRRSGHGYIVRPEDERAQNPRIYNYVDPE